MYKIEPFSGRKTSVLNRCIESTATSWQYDAIKSYRQPTLHCLSLHRINRDTLNMPQLSLDEIKQLSFDAMRRCGASELQAEAAAVSLMDAEAEGIRNVGLGYLSHYLNHLRCGKLAANAVPEIVRTSAASTVVNANFGFCHTAYLHVEDQVIEKAQKEGVSLLSINHSYSAGVLGWFVRRLAQRGMVSLMFANSSKAVAAHGGKSSFFGTNPFAFGSPRGQGEPVVVDMATAATARVNIVDAAREGRPIEPGLAIDSDGNPTTDAAEALKGAQLPFAGPKGFGVGLIVDLLGGVLTGSNCSFEAPLFANNEGGPPNVGQTIIVMNPDFYSDSYLSHIETMFSALTEDNEVRIPGERRQMLREKHSSEGVDVPQSLIDKINELSQ